MKTTEPTGTADHPAGVLDNAAALLALEDVGDLAVQLQRHPHLQDALHLRLEEPGIARVGEQATHGVVEFQVLVHFDPVPALAIVMAAQDRLSVGRDQECLWSVHGVSNLGVLFHRAAPLAPPPV